MNRARKRWTVLVLLGVLAVSFILPAMPKPKARAHRIQSINHVATASMALPKSDTLPTRHPD